MTRPDFKAEAREVVKLAREMEGAAEYLIALKLELIFETGRGAGADEHIEQLSAALNRLGRKPS